MEDAEIMHLVFLVLRFLSALLFVGLAFLGIPYAIKDYEKWKQTNRPKDFAGFVGLGCLSFIFVSYFDVILISALVKYDSFFSLFYGYNRLLFMLGIVLLLSYVTIPRSFRFFSLWKENRHPKILAKMIFFAVISFYALSFAFVLYLPKFFYDY